MDAQEIIEEAIRTLTINKLRTGLAALGIIIGIGSVIALVSLSQSSQASCYKPNTITRGKPSYSYSRKSKRWICTRWCG